MKKLIFAIAVLLMSSNLFADYILQQDITGLGKHYNLSTNCFNANDKISVYKDFAAFCNTKTTVAYEFLSEPDYIFHPYIGGTIGASLYGLPIALNSGVNISLYNIGHGKLELNAGSNVGILQDILWGLTFGYVSSSVDLVLMPNNTRKGWFGSIGAEVSCSIESFNYYKEYGLVAAYNIQPGLHFTIGYHFPTN